MYKLYYDPGSANMAPHAILEEIGAPHELILVDITKRAHHDPEYLKLNPNARVPTLIDGDLVMYESAAICQYLCDRHPEADLAPVAGSRERGPYYQWLMYLSNTLQEGLMHYHHAEHFAEAACQPSVKARAEERLERMFVQLDGALASRGPYLLGSRFSACDIYLTMLARWSRTFSKPAVAHPNIRRLVEMVSARPAYRRMMKAEGI